MQYPTNNQIFYYTTPFCYHRGSKDSHKFVCSAIKPRKMREGIERTYGSIMGIAQDHKEARQSEDESERRGQDSIPDTKT